MDGSLGRQFLQGRNIAPVSTSFAVAALPSWIYGLATNNPGFAGQVAVRVSVQSDSLGHRIVLLNRNLGVAANDHLVLLYSDFIICQQIAGSLNLPLFPQETSSQVMVRISGLVQVQFANRPG